MAKFLLCFLMIIFLLPFVSAFEISNVKSTYLPRETFQAELTAQFAKRPVAENFVLLKDKQSVTAIFSIEQIASNKFFVYFNLPETPGEYSFAAKDIMYAENSTLKKKTIEKNFTIKKPIYLAHSYLSDVSWQGLNTDEIALSLAALTYNSSVVNAGKAALLAKRNDTHWENVKSTSLALIALKEIDATTEKEQAKEWIINSQNSVDRGLWTLVTDSNVSAVCKLKINQNEQEMSVAPGIVSHSFSMPLDKTIDILLLCGTLVNVNAKVSNTYQGSVTDFQMIAYNDSLKISINNQKCWGTSQQSECNADSTAYALWALEELGALDLDTEWLSENDLTTIQKSFLYITSEDSEIEEWLLQNQAVEGYFSERDLAISKNPDVLSTIIACYALSKSASEENKAASEKAKMWLLGEYESSSSNNFGNLPQTSFALYKIFPYSEIEPILTIKPAVIKAKSGEKFEITMKNYGMSKVNVVAKIGDDEKEITINKDEENKLPFTFSSESAETVIKNMELTYHSYSNATRKYNIPVIVFPSAADIDEEINATSIEESLVKQDIAFVDEKVEKNYGTGDKEIIEINIKNPSSEIVTGISIGYSNNLRSLISVKPTSLNELLPGQTATIFIVVDAGEEKGIYSGFIEVQSSSFSAQLPVSINVGEKSETETNETITNETISEEPKAEEKKTNMGLIIGIVLISIAVLAVAVYFITRLKNKKPEKGIQETFQKIEDKYKPESGRLIRY